MVMESDEVINEKTIEKVKEILIRQFDELITKRLETISRFAQSHLRALIAKGIRVNYNVRYDRDRFGWKITIEVSIPDWWLDEIAEKKVRILSLLRKMEYNIRRADQYLKMSLSDVAGTIETEIELEEALAEMEAEGKREGGGSEGSSGGGR